MFCQTKDYSYKPILLNQVDGKSHSKALVHDVVVRKLTYEDKDAKREIINIYKKSQALILINYLYVQMKEIEFWIHSQVQVSFII